LAFLDLILKANAPFLSNVHKNLIPCLLNIVPDPKFETFFKKLPRIGYSIPNAIFYARQYYYIFTSDEQWFRLDEVKLCESIFLHNPSNANAMELAMCLVENTASFDCLFLMLGKLSLMEERFVSVFLLIFEFLKNVCDSDMKEEFRKAVDHVVGSLPFASRGLALSYLLEGKMDAAFLCALRESDDVDL
jgi:hypothetical protein